MGIPNPQALAHLKEEQTVCFHPLFVDDVEPGGNRVKGRECTYEPGFHEIGSLCVGGVSAHQIEPLKEVIMKLHETDHGSFRELVCSV